LAEVNPPFAAFFVEAAFGKSVIACDQILCRQRAGYVAMDASVSGLFQWPQLLCCVSLSRVGHETCPFLTRWTVEIKLTKDYRKTI